MSRKAPSPAVAQTPVSANQPPVAPGVPPAINKPKPPKSPASPAADAGTTAPVTGPGTAPMKRGKAGSTMPPPAVGKKPAADAVPAKPPVKKPFPGAAPPFQAKR